MVEEPHAPQEEDRVSAWIIAAVALVTLLVFTVGVWVAWAMLPAAPGFRVAPIPNERYGWDPAPIDVTLRAEDYFARERERLESYGWVDETRGIARVPIERAMRMFLDRREGR